MYSALGSKARILQRITDAWMVEAQTVDLAKASLRETDPRRQLRLLAAINRRQLEVGSDVIAIYQEAARADPRMAETLHQVLAAREREIRKLLTSVTGHDGALDVDAALAVALALTVPEVYRTLVTERGWSPERYETWLGDALVTQIFPVA